jgi:hypothetical protein
MKRRRLLQSIAALPLTQAGLAQTPARAAAAEPAPEVASVPVGAVGRPVARFFTEAQFRTLERLAEVLMPPVDERPGSKQAHVAEFLDFLISESPADRQRLYRTGLDRLSKEGIDAASLKPLTAPWTYDGPPDLFAQFLLAAKEDVMRATYNSREFAAAMSQTRRGFSGSGYYWTVIE